MKQLDYYIQEKLKITKDTKINIYNYHPKDKDELKELVKELIKERGKEADLNDIDTSKITSMSYLFEKIEFNGDISEWNISNVKDMRYMFIHSKFTGENGDISKWDVSNVKEFEGMFAYSEFNQDIDNWNINNNADMLDIFRKCPLEKNPPQWYHE